MAIEATGFPDKNSVVRAANGADHGCHRFQARMAWRCAVICLGASCLRKALWGGALALSVCLITAVPGSTQPRPFMPTIEEPPPGVFHGNTSDNLADQFQRQAVYYRSQHPVGTIIVETRERHLYLIESETRALRYGIGVGREGFTWSGLLQITQKQEWPDWHPPPEMIAAPALSAALHGRRPGQSARRARHASRQPRSIASTAPMRRKRSDTPCRPAVSAWSTRT